MNLLKALRHRPFAWLWAGQTISRIGDSLHYVALTWWFVEKTGSAAAIGKLLIFSFTPMVIFSLLGGVAVDRLPRLLVMLLSDVFRGLLLTLVALLAFTNRLEIWHLYVTATAFGFVDAFFQPAYTAALPDLTPPELLTSANSLTALSSRILGIAGPAIGATLVGLGGTSVAFALDASSFFVSATCLLRLPRLGPARASDAPPSSMLGDIREGLQTVFAIPWIWITIAIFGLANISFSGPWAVALPILVKQTLGGNVSALGLASSMNALGAVLSALVLGRLPRIRHRGLWAYGGTILSASVTALLGWPIGVVGLAVVSLINGAAIAVFGLIWTNTLQEMVPRNRLGRVASVDFLGSFVLLPIGYGLTGWATDRVGAPQVFLVGGIMTTIILMLGLLHPAVRRLD